MERDVETPPRGKAPSRATSALPDRDKSRVARLYSRLIAGRHAPRNSTGSHCSSYDTTHLTLASSQHCLSGIGTNAERDAVGCACMPVAEPNGLKPNYTPHGGEICFYSGVNDAAFQEARVARSRKGDEDRCAHK